MMKNIRYKNNYFLCWIVFIVFNAVSVSSFAQVKVDFEPRTSSKAPAPFKNVKNYNVQGDFIMLGNTSMTLSTYDASNGSNSNSKMIYTDVDADSNTVNSSSAELVIPDKECSEVVYAGLYWTGRAHDKASPDIFSVTKNKKKYTLNKRVVKLKADNANYIDIEASKSDIYYPNNKDGNMYSAYADITDYVRTHGAASYTVANMALIEGDGGGTGFYGGWGIVVIYKNSSKTWRNITVFDGHAYVSGGGGIFGGYNYHYLDIDGFKATQYGTVNVTLGMMAGEGDKTIKGDNFALQKQSGGYENLKHAGNATDNFFNSSIEVGGTARNPKLVNNTGFDIARFNVENKNNSFITNGQTKTTFRYGSKQDTYIIFNMVFAVDSYVPEVLGENKPVTKNGFTPVHGGTVNPDQELEFQLDVFNKGTEALKNTKIEIPVPFNLHYVGSTVNTSLDGKGTVSWLPPAGGTNDPSVTAGGTIVWTIGKLPTFADKTKLLAQLNYRFKVSNDCMLLATNVCEAEIRINGKISAIGEISDTNVNSDLIRDYGTDICGGAVYDDFMSKIVLSSDYTKQCSASIVEGKNKITAFCSLENNSFKRSDVVKHYPSGTKFYSTIPDNYGSTIDLVSGDFVLGDNGADKVYYAIVPGMTDGCYAILELSVDKVESSPSATNIALCQGEQLVLETELSEEGKVNKYDLVYFDGIGNLLVGIPNPTEVGTHIFSVAEGKDGCYGPKVEFVIVINTLPSIDKVVADIVVCENFDQAYTIPAVSTGVVFKWEYAAVGTTNWQELTNTTFSNVVKVFNNEISISHASKEINGVSIRLNVANGQCTDVSNEFEIKVTDCSGVTNPMLLNATN